MINPKYGRVLLTTIFAKFDVEKMSDEEIINTFNNMGIHINLDEFVRKIFFTRFKYPVNSPCQEVRGYISNL